MSAPGCVVQGPGCRSHTGRQMGGRESEIELSHFERVSMYSSCHCSEGIEQSWTENCLNRWAPVAEKSLMSEPEDVVENLTPWTSDYGQGGVELPGPAFVVVVVAFVVAVVNCIKMSPEKVCWLNICRCIMKLEKRSELQIKLMDASVNWLPFQS